MSLVVFAQAVIGGFLGCFIAEIVIKIIQVYLCNNE